MKISYSRAKSALAPLCACLIVLTSLGAQAATEPAEAPQVLSHPTISQPLSRYSVDPADQTLRQTVQRWALGSGWSFPNENWVPNVDIPVIGSASFQGDFIHAVQSLVATTELTETPLQPCFYQNMVVRVIYFNQSCDKMSER